MFYGLLIQTVRGKRPSAGGGTKKGKQRSERSEKVVRQTPLLLHWGRGAKGLSSHWDPGGTSGAH
jgi:hypothetical protein